MRLIVPALAILLSGCGGVETVLGPCSGTRIVDVQTGGAGVAPVISWAPRCGAAWIVVQDVTTTAPPQPAVWTVIDTDQLFEPPVTYGVLPRGHDAGAVKVGPEPLVAGHVYKVTIYRQRSENESVGEEAGANTFTY